MKKLLGNIIKNGAIMFAVGMLLGLAAPPLAQLLGASLIGDAAFAHAVATPVLWTGAFFGAFGAIHAAVQPLYEHFFDKKTSPAAESKEKPRTRLIIALGKAPQQEQAPCCANHGEKILAERSEQVTQIVRQ